MPEATVPPATTPLARSPLAHRGPVYAADGAASLAEWPFVSKVIVRADPAVASAAVEAAIGVALPAAPLASATAGECSVLWLGPDEFMVLSARATAADLADRLETGLAALHRQVVDVSDHHTIVTVSGTRARDLLARLLTVDLHPLAFPEGRVVSTLAGHATVTVWLRDGSPAPGGTFDVIVRASFADYLWCLLCDAGRGFGLPPAEPVAGEPMRP